ncbi:MAG TPA: PEP-CTERM sorting domain-containing protein [Methylomirabilota bacterium]|nr:PEP-CTERM sorting domain-containing protein [Methylomirabilota bacterium]
MSFANNTGSGGVVVAPNASPPLTPANATETFSISIPAGFASLSLIVWADDTGGVRLDGGATYLAATNGTSAPNPVQGTHCANGGLTCTPGGGSTFLIALGGAVHTIQFDVFQRGDSTFGLLYQGDLTPVPEPASLLLVGSALAAVGFVSRRRMQKNQTQAQ